ncbi:MAG: hypothetical protein ABJC89_22860, partial [Acidobacteriota bacterium]
MLLLLLSARRRALRGSAARPVSGRGFPWPLAVAMLVLVLGAAGSASAATGEKLDFALRGKPLVLTIYPPAGVPKGTILMASGD